MKCTMQWGNKCSAEAVYELRQWIDVKDHSKGTYYLGFECETHLPTKTAHVYVIEVIENES